MFERGERRVGVKKEKGTEKMREVMEGGRRWWEWRERGEKMTDIVCSLLPSPSTP